MEIDYLYGWIKIWSHIEGSRPEWWMVYVKHDYIVGIYHFGQKPLIRRNVTENGEPQRCGWEHRRRRSEVCIKVCQHHENAKLSKQMQACDTVCVLLGRNTSNSLSPLIYRLPLAHTLILHTHHLVGLVVRRPPQERKIPGSNPAWAGIFPGSSHTSDLKIGTPVATLPGAWRYRVSTGTGWPGVSILWLGEVERLICNLYLSVAARKIV